MPENTVPLSPQSWSELPNGEQIKDLIEHTLTPWWPKVFGYHMLNLGALSAKLNMPELPIGRCFSLYDGDSAAVRANFTALPIQNGVIDAVVMNMLLEFETDPYKMLRETDRVLISGGYLFIIGFNPLSPAFIGKLLPKYQQQLPWCGRFFMPSRVKDWLGLLGYQVISDERFLYHHLLSELREESIWQDALQAWLPSSGSMYLIVARKLESPLTPIQEKRKVRPTQWATAPSAGRNEHYKTDNS
ncbi:methyltransferase domain-containing protein [Shewanella sp. D64]|uniref:class I SAM-dependent methyltransferase n=1 Tax=unclassified Shewanella TaxID=196818 RepID=UPI0022BA4BCE|nr:MULTISPECIES: methyltransferase domain-containing protein [unclassified Shewanella]MEC4725306.1 methyltransferase domain-containing protein [Shewanella sp. D64]MEC4735848.1 methyltransferase domain-containing protein [Shewanella sp. E94]WBJ93181.1 methyltransferase domain-containing protein [Shewanella sp. MTB7]